jgi:transposase
VGRRKLSREFKLEAVKLVRDRGVKAAQASRDLDVHANVLGKWLRELERYPAQAFPGHGQVKPQKVVIDRPRKEVAKLMAERDILKKREPWCATGPRTIARAAMASLFSSLKTERIGTKTCRTRDAARADVFDYIERFHNTVRRHSTIGYLGPVEFERKAGSA